MSAALRIRPEDDVAVALEPIGAGETVLGVTAREDIPAGHGWPGWHGRWACRT